MESAISANRFAKIRQTISFIARPKHQSPPEARARLTAFAAEYGRRERELEEKAAKLRRERDEAIRLAYREDLTMAEIAKALKMSHQRVSQIIRS